MEFLPLSLFSHFIWNEVGPASSSFLIESNSYPKITYDWTYSIHMRITHSHTHIIIVLILHFPSLFICIHSSVFSLICHENIPHSKLNNLLLLSQQMMENLYLYMNICLSLILVTPATSSKWEFNLVNIRNKNN